MQCSLVERLGLPMAALCSIKFCQVVQADRCIRMRGAQQFLSDEESLLQKWFSFLIAALSHIESCQIIQAASTLRQRKIHDKIGERKTSAVGERRARCGQ